MSDLRYALRALRQSPGFTAAAVLCLALGIGANATMFGVVDALLLKPPAGVETPGRVARLYFSRTWPGIGATTSAVTSYPGYADLVELPAFSSVAGYTARTMTLGRGAEARGVDAVLVTPRYFSLLGVRPALGRFFLAEEERADGPPVAVLSHAFWRRELGGAPNVIGDGLQLGRQRVTVVGVAPKGFVGVDVGDADLWLPIATAAGGQLMPEWRTYRSTFFLAVIARLRHRATPEQAAAMATLVHRRAHAQEPMADSTARVVVASLLPARGPTAGPEGKVAVWLAGMAAVVLLVACANVANLLLVRGIQRRREIAVRLAVGAGRGRIASQLLTESLVLAALGAVTAIAVIVWGGALVRAYLLGDGVRAPAALDWRVLAFTAVATAITGLVCGVAPVLGALRCDVASTLKAGVREGGAPRSRLRSALLVGQVALTLVLLAGAGLFVRSLRNLRGLDLGLDVSRVVLLNVDVQGAGYAPGDADAVYRRLLARAGELPGVERAGLATTAPFWSSTAYGVHLPGQDSLPSLAAGGPYYNAVNPGFFATVGARLRRGRVFTDADRAGTAPVALVNETMARRYWPAEDALGKCFRVGGPEGPCRQVVGVVGDTRRMQVQEEPAAQFYLPLDQEPDPMPMRVLFVRLSPAAAEAPETIRAAIQRTASDLPAVTAVPLRDAVDAQLRPWRLGAAMFSAFGLLALTLAAVGLFGVTAYTVGQRTQEMGVRMALGARPADVFRLVVGRGLRVAALGLVIGAAAALVAGRALSSLLVAVEPRDPLILALVAATLLAVTLLASYLPARRAARIQPAVALRQE
ncbi:MAG TPA: ABC transporter permease [Gemmatimonadaceae bacterium]|nr:ABC transporter permease [Gemmatimonadaceae bacterium]